LVGIDAPASSCHKLRSLPSTDGSVFLKKRIKDIYVKTEGCEEMISLATSSERPTVTAPVVGKFQARETVGTPLKLQEFSEK
jgi:hypothetical protein